MRREKFFIVLLYLLIYGFLFLALALRIYFPPNDIRGTIFLALMLILVYLFYPNLAGIAVKFFNDLAEGKSITWSETKLFLQKRYHSALLITSVLICIYLLISLVIYSMFGERLIEYFKWREATLDKTQILWEGIFAMAVLYLIALEFLPVLFPIGIIVLLHPSSEYFFAGAAMSVFALIIFAPLFLKNSLWLPHALLGVHLSPWRAFKEAYHITSFSVTMKILKAILLLIVLSFISICLFFYLLLKIPYRFFLFKIGRWPIDFYGIIFAVVFAFIFPSVISLLFWRQRIHIYRKLTKDVER